MTNNADYTEEDKSRMRYYLKEMESKFERYPESLTLRNGIAHIRSILGLPKTIDKIDPMRHINQLMQQEFQKKRGD
jgi:hypothetical protein